MIIRDIGRGVKRTGRWRTYNRFSIKHGISHVSVCVYIHTSIILNGWNNITSMYACVVFTQCCLSSWFRVRVHYGRRTETRPRQYPPWDTGGDRRVKTVNARAADGQPRGGDVRARVDAPSSDDPPGQRATRPPEDLCTRISVFIRAPFKMRFWYNTPVTFEHDMVSCVFDFTIVTKIRAVNRSRALNRKNKNPAHRTGFQFKNNKSLRNYFYYYLRLLLLRWFSIDHQPRSNTTLALV